MYFYPRPPRGGRRAVYYQSRSEITISIHALREEGDAVAPRFDFVSIDFYPRPPRGGRLGCSHVCIARELFLSTPSARRATRLFSYPYHKIPISIHALREEGDVLYPTQNCNQVDFYPRPPRGGRPPAIWMRLLKTLYFYPRPPRGGRRRSAISVCVSCRISIHALREEGDETNENQDYRTSRFLSTPSARRATMLKVSVTLCSNDFYPRPPRGGRLDTGLKTGK